MTFKNVSWNKNDQLSDAKFQKMIDNDDYNYSLARKSPRGLLFVYNFPQTSPGLIQVSSNTNTTVPVFSSIKIFGKNIDLSHRMIKVCISDCTINDTSVGSTPVSSRKSLLYNFNFQNENLSYFKEIDVFSEFRPFNGSLFQGNWRTQGIEFLVQSPGFSSNPDFLVSCSVRKIETEVSTSVFSITYGTISLYDVGEV
jgi:hypothetical protein